MAPFVDDFLLMICRILLQQHVCIVKQTFARLGWTINHDKCDWQETTQTVFVGFIVKSDTDNGPWLQVLPAKIRKLRRIIVKALHSHHMPVCNLAKIAGQCISMTKAIVPGKLLLCNIYRIIASRKDWNASVCLDQPAVKDLNWWLSVLKGWNSAPLVSK